MKIEEIYFVLVLYKESLKTSKTIATLGSKVPNGTKLLVYDNSPLSQYQNNKFSYENFDIEYFHDSSNKGLSVAYNYALTKASNYGYLWLLLLDQDTTFNVNFINSVLNLNLKNSLAHNTVAIIPRVKDLTSQKVISPSKFFKGGIVRPIDISTGLVNYAITGINSGTILNVPYLNEISGFNTDFSLDMLDHWYFKKIYADSKNIYLLDSTIFQNLSIFGNFESNVSVERYQQLLSAEKKLILQDGIFSVMVFKIRLFIRCFKQVSISNKNYLKLTLKAIL